MSDAEYRYQREDFERVPFAKDTFYCPGCNRSSENYIIDSDKCSVCPPGRRGTLSLSEVNTYLIGQLATGIRVTPLTTTYHLPDAPSRTTYEEVPANEIIPAFGDVITDEHGHLYKVRSREELNNGRTHIEAVLFDEP